MRVNQWPLKMQHEGMRACGSQCTTRPGESAHLRHACTVAVVPLAYGALGSTPDVAVSPDGCKAWKRGMAYAERAYSLSAIGTHPHRLCGEAGEADGDVGAPEAGRRVVGRLQITR